MPTDVAEGRIKADEASHADVQVAAGKRSIRRSVRSFGTTANLPASRRLLDLYLINSQTKHVPF